MNFILEFFKKECAFFFNRKNVFKIISYISILFFVYIVSNLDLYLIVELLKKISLLNFVILIFARIFYWVIRTYNWKLIINRFKENYPFLQLFKVRMAGYTISTVTPSANIGGEIVRFLMVKGISKKKVLASMILDKTIEITVTIIYVTFGIILGIMRFQIPILLKIIFFLTMVVGLFFLIYIQKIQKEGFLIWITNKIKRITRKNKFFNKHINDIEETDLYISDFYKKYKGDYKRVFLQNILLVLTWTFEIFLTFKFVGAKITFLDCFIIVSMGVIAFIIPTLPNSIGLYELTYLGIFTMLGIDVDYGIAFIIMRRVLGISIAGIGLIFLFLDRNIIREAKMQR